MGSDSLGDSSLTHGKVLGVWVAEKESHVLKPDMSRGFKLKSNLGFQSFQFLLSLKDEIAFEYYDWKSVLINFG